jgi:aminoacylase
MYTHVLTYYIFYDFRWVKIEAVGSTGHGSRFIDCTAVEQLVGVVNKALAFRQDQKDLLFGRGVHAGCDHAVAKSLGDVTSLNVTMMRAGLQSNGVDVLNVIPPAAEAGLDIRISPHVDPLVIGEMITSWCQECQLEGGTVRWKYIEDGAQTHATTSIDPRVNPWWTLVTDVIENDLHITCVPSVFPAATDSRFLRAMGVRAIGFSPMRHSPILLHEHDEYITEDTFLEGCHVFITLLSTAAAQAAFPDFGDEF